MIGRLTFHHLVSLGFWQLFSNPYPQFSLSHTHTHTHARTHTHTDTSLFIPFKYFTSSNYSSRNQEK
ncbi:hypothetical protein E4U34_007404 [Claviceps purpurea]|nr:hypothetical protein E4U34_007404 [Claviceps purpurea]